MYISATKKKLHTFPLDIRRKLTYRMSRSGWRCYWNKKLAKFAKHLLTTVTIKLFEAILKNFFEYFLLRLVFDYQILRILEKVTQLSLREKCPNTEFFLVCIFPHSDWIWRGTEYLSVFSPNAGKYGPEKTPYLDTFHAVYDLTNNRKI